MNKLFTLFLLFFIIVICAESMAQVKGDIMLSYTVLNGAHNDKSMYPFVFGVNLEKRISKRKFAPWSVHTRFGFRYYRSGYGLASYMRKEPEYYKKHNISSFSDTESMLVQSFLSTPLGVELRLNPRPATTKHYIFSISILLNNSYLLSSSLKERVYSFNAGGELTQSVTMTDYTGKYHIGGTLEFRFTRFLNVGFIYQPISYRAAKDILTFNAQSGSPYYETISHNGVYHDFSFYVGVNIPLSVFKKKDK